MMPLDDDDYDGRIIETMHLLVAATKFLTERSRSLLTLQSSAPTTAEGLCTVVKRKTSAICSHQ